MKNLSRIVFLAALVVSCSEDTIVGSGDLVSEERIVASFSRISSDGIIDVELVQEQVQFVQITADDNIIDRVKTQVVNGELQLFLEGDSYRDIRINAQVSTPSMTGIRNTGTGGITARALKGADIFTVTNSGTGSITLLGRANSLTLVNEGSGDLKAFECEVSEADLTLIGSGNAELHCTESMQVLIEGSGNVYYRGNPTIEASIEGSGKVVDAN